LLVAALWLAGRHEESRETALRYLTLYPGSRAQRGQRQFTGPQTVWGQPFVQALVAAGVPP
jgi:hypothetical protein